MGDSSGDLELPAHSAWVADPQIPARSRAATPNRARFSYNVPTVPKYSIVVPLHDEQENVTELYDRLKAVMETTGESFELVLVDDGSHDNTFPLLREIAAIDSRVTVV